MGLAILVLGLAAFLGPHVFVTLRGPRAGAIHAMGGATYKIAFSLLSAIGIGLIAYGFWRYRAEGMIALWYPPAWTRHVAVAAMWPVSIMLVAWYLRGRIYAILKHPMLVATKLWAVAHLIANGDLGSVILFGSFLAWAVYDRISLKRRPEGGAGALSVGGVRNDILAVVIGTVLYLALGFLFHPYVVGVPAFGR